MAWTTKSRRSQTEPSSAKAASSEPGCGHVAIDERGRAQRLDQGDHPLPERFALVGEGELGALAGQRLGDTPGDRTIVGNPHDEAAFAGHDARMTCHTLFLKHRPAERRHGFAAERAAPRHPSRIIL